MGHRGACNILDIHRSPAVVDLLGVVSEAHMAGVPISAEGILILI